MINRTQSYVRFAGSPDIKPPPPSPGDDSSMQAFQPPTLLERTPSYGVLLQLGLSPIASHKLDTRLTLTHDRPYHGGRLLNGKIYLITHNDQVYYGTPEGLKQLNLVSATRTKCINQQERTFQSEEGLFFRVKRNQDQQVASVSGPWYLGLHLPIAHWQQISFKPPAN